MVCPKLLELLQLKKSAELSIHQIMKSLSKKLPELYYHNESNLLNYQYIKLCNLSVRGLMK